MFYKVMDEEKNMQPLLADFNEFDEEGAVLIGVPPFLDMRLQKTDFVPNEGARVLISDGGIETMGRLSFRDKGQYKYWVVVRDEGGFREVPKDAWYHQDNLEKKE
jgi:hypothetical protein